MITTPAAARRLTDWGFAALGLETWSSTRLERPGESLTVEALPGIHARGLMGALLPPVMGSLLVHRVDGAVRRTTYLTGDTLTGEHVSEIARRHPGIDTVVAHLGGTRVLLHTVTMDAEQGVDLVRRIGPGEVVPVHYDDYRVFRSPLSAFVGAYRESGLTATLRQVRRGETLELGDPVER